MARVLVIDDDEVTCELLAEVLQREGLDVSWETDPRCALQAVKAESPDLAMIDIRMPHVSGLDLLQQLRECAPNLPIVIMTAFGSVETTVQAFGAGAVDYVSKPMDLDVVSQVVRRALDRHGEVEARLPSQSEELGGLVGRTPVMVEVYKTIARTAPGTSTILILGESGTGKDLVARAIHDHSPRRNGPFVAVDCTGLPEALLESELFGHRRGAFTDAVRDEPGLFAEADGGTLFLDEVGELSPPLQAKLLRVLHEKHIRPVGDTQWRAVDVRVIAATNRDLPSAVTAGRFREDLYYRLKVVTIHMPPLRARRQDIPLLVDHLIRKAAHQCGKRVKGVSEAALAVLSAYDWPGNVRELAHVLERSVALGQHEILGIEDLPRELSGDRSISGRNEELPTDRPTLEELKRRYILRVFEENKGNMTRIAAILGVDRRSLYRTLQRYGINPRGAAGK